MRKPALAVIGSETSEEAARKIEPQRGKLQTLCYLAIKSAGASGMTAQEVETATGLPGNTVRPRIVELWEQQRIERTGERRPTRSGRMAVVWIARR